MGRLYSALQNGFWYTDRFASLPFLVEPASALMPKQSAGLLTYRRQRDRVEFFLVHPGGPFWRKKDLGAWSIPKGEFADGEDPLKAARREFQEETGVIAPGPFTPLTP